MAKERDNEEEELSEAQRLSLLEKAMGTNRVVLLILSLLIIITLSVTVTMALVSAFTEDEAGVAPQEMQALQQRIDALETENRSLAARVTVLTEEIPKLRTALNNGAAPTFQRLMIDQEENHQAFIRGVKEGMYDLARMIPGSRTWLELYTDKMDRALAQSQNRQRELTRLQTGTPLVEP